MSVNNSIPILIVDDYNTMIRIIRNLLRQLGVIAAKRAGVSNYIVKPFNAQTLKSKIDAVFGVKASPAA